MREKSFKKTSQKLGKIIVLTITLMLITFVMNAQKIRVLHDGNLSVSEPENEEKTFPNQNVNAKDFEKCIDYPLREMSVTKLCEQEVYATIASRIAAARVRDCEKYAWGQAAFVGTLTDDYGRAYKYPLPLDWIETYNQMCNEYPGCRTPFSPQQPKEPGLLEKVAKDVAVETGTYIARSLPQMSGKTLAITGGALGGIALLWGIGSAIMDNAGNNAAIAQAKQRVQNEIKKQQELEHQEKLKEGAKEVEGMLKGTEETKTNNPSGLRNNATLAKPDCPDCDPVILEKLDNMQGKINEFKKNK